MDKFTMIIMKPHTHSYDRDEYPPQDVYIARYRRSYG